MANVYGDDSNQALKGTAGADQLYGGAGEDILLGGPLGALTDLKGNGSVDSPFYFDLTSATGNDVLEGGTGADALFGGDGDDILYGGEGSEAGIVNNGGDYYKAGLYGGDGNDVIYGGGGNDELYGGLGKDELYGGQGADKFIFASAAEIGKGSSSDYIGDFRSKQGDIIDLSLIDAKENKGGNQKFKYIGDDKFSGKQGELSYKNGKVKGDTDGDGKADFVLLVNTNKMGADDFIL